jgi:type II secretion system protein H
VNVVPPKARRRACSGFTLIELMVVAVVTAMLLSAVIPSLATAARGRAAKRTATKAFDMLNFACAAAIARRQPVIVNFDSDRHVCWVSVEGMSLPWLSEDRQVQALTLASVELPDGVEVSFHRDAEPSHSPRSGQKWETIRFEPDGTAEDMVIELADRTGDAYAVEIVAATGEITLEREQ